jgi:hypothetical protein
MRALGQGGLDRLRVPIFEMAGNLLVLVPGILWYQLSHWGACLVKVPNVHFTTPYMFHALSVGRRSSQRHHSNPNVQ